MLDTIKIGEREIGTRRRVFIIAEAGVNHNGDLKRAFGLVDAAVDAGADAVKFQTFKADRVISPSAPKAEYQLRATDPAESQLEMARRLELSPEAHRELQSYCRKRAILFLSTAFDEESVDLLDELGVPAFKIASGEITNGPLLEYIARKGKPLILSTGMSYLSEVDDAVRKIRRTGNLQLVLMHCTSNYPANPADVNLKAIKLLEKAFQVPVGYSDHTLGHEIVLAAVALGACVVEKHLTLDTNLPGPDHRASLSPEQFRTMVQGIRMVEMSLGHGRKEPAASEAKTAAVARRSLVAARDIPAGTELTDNLIAVKRPGNGLPPALRHFLIGRTVKTAIPAGALISLEVLE